MSDSRVLDKIKKCLALSESSEPHEAAAAMRQAQKLMDIHNISMTQVQRADIGETSIRSKVSVSKPKDWEVALVATVGKAFGCRIIWTRSSSYSDNVFGQFTMVGIKSQLELASYTCDVMTRKLVKARAAFVNGQSGYMDRKQKTVQADGFCKGWVSTIKKTVMEFATPEATKLLIEGYVQDITHGKKADVKASPAGHAGYLAGMTAAAGESIHRPMGAATHLKLSTS